MERVVNKKESGNVMVSGLHLAGKQYQLNREGKRLNLGWRTVFSLTFSVESFYFPIAQTIVIFFPFKQSTEVVPKKAVKLI